jgi:uncharacterized repeat protein (TIGR01451 family)
VTDQSGTAIDNNDPTIVPVSSSPSIALVKTGVLSTDGNTITYSFTVTNTGNVPLTGVTVSDPKLGGSITLSSTSLSASPGPGHTATGTATYTVTTADRSAGAVENTATASGNPPTGSPVTDQSGTAIDNNDPTIVPVSSSPSIALVKTGVLSTDGNTITYSFTVINTGNVTLTGVAVNDPLLGGAVTVSPTTLEPDGTATGTATYTVTQANREAGNVTNQATVTGNPPTGSPVTDQSGSTLTDNTPTVTPVPPKCPEGIKCLSVKVNKTR